MHADRQIRRPRWLIPLVLGVAAGAELASAAIMTVYRYRAQEMEPEFFGLSRTGDILGLLLALSVITLFIVLGVRAKRRRVWLAAVAAVLSVIGLAVLSAAPLVDIEDRNYILAGYLAFKAFEISLLWTSRVDGRAWYVTLSRSVVMTLLLTAAAMFVVVGTVLLSPASSAFVEEPNQVYDAGVILGAAVWSKTRPSPVFRERIRTGYGLLRQGVVQNLVVTGANAPNELTEAEVARRELLKLGADPTRIVIENQTRSTVQQVLFVRDRLLKQGWDRFLIISDQFHLTRALEICDFNGIQAQGVSSESPLGPQNLAVYHLRESVALVLYWMYGV